MTINMSRGRKDDIFKGSGTLISYWPCLKPLRNHLSVSQTMKCSLYFLNQYLAESGHWGFSFYDKRCSSATSNIIRLIGWLVRMSSCRLAVVVVRCALIVFTWVQMILELFEKWNVDLSSTLRCVLDNWRYNKHCEVVSCSFIWRWCWTVPGQFEMINRQPSLHLITTWYRVCFDNLQIPINVTTWCQLCSLIGQE